MEGYGYICENDYSVQINVIFKVSANGRDPFMKARFTQPFMHFMVSNKQLMVFFLGFNTFVRQAKIVMRV